MFFYIAKIVWFIVQPSALMLAALGLALWSLARSRLRATRGWLLAGLAIGLAGISPLPNLLVLPLEQRFERADLATRPVTGIVVLGGGEDAEVALARHAHGLNEAGERISEAVALARALPQARVVFSGGPGRLLPGGAREGDAVRRMLVSMGVEPARLTIEDRSRDTWENAVFTRELVKPATGERWLLVTSAWHMPRSMGVFRKAGFPVEPWPVDYRTAGMAAATQFFTSPADGLRRLEMVVKEYTGLAVYRLNGRSSALFPAPCVGSPVCE